MTIQAPEGTCDLLPDEARRWDNFRRRAFEIFGNFGYQPIHTPIFEQTELFVRGIGNATDVVSKEMFTTISGGNLEKLLAGEEIKDKSRLSLRPEGTAGVVRAVIQHDLVPNGAAPAKLMYAGPMFRAERPQKGRLRQFRQIGIECLGADSPSIDAEAITMLMTFLHSIAIPPERMTLLLNSMGCEKCRPTYREKVRAYILENAENLCEECCSRAQSNPLRAFDCKNPKCARVMDFAPRITDYLCDDCREHHETVKDLLDEIEIPYTESPKLVRGLDYYTRTVFEVQVSTGLGAQNAIGGGGRYDRLVEEVGGRPTSGLGFAIGYERCILALEAACVPLAKQRGIDVFFACVNEEVRKRAFIMAYKLRNAGISAELDHQNRSLKSQFKMADKLQARWVVIVGPEELAQEKVRVRDMQTHTETVIDLPAIDNFISSVGITLGEAL